MRSSFPVAMLVGFFITCMMFVGLFMLIHRGGMAVDATDVLPTIDFVRIKRQTELQTIERRKPEPPPPPKQPPPPQKLEVAADTPRNESPLPFDAPNLGLSSNIGGGPFVGPMAAGGGGGNVGMFDGDIIPIARVQAQYPRNAARDGIEGMVLLEIVVNPDGTVRSARVIEAKPRGVFDAAAVQAALKWKFKPKVVNGVAVPQTGRQPFEFKLGEE